MTHPEVAGWFTAPNYYDQLADLRATAPVRAYAPHSFTVARYRDVREISRDTERFCSGRGVLMNDPIRGGGDLPGSILHMDPPIHAPWRNLVSRRFTPRSMAAFEHRIRAIARAIVAEAPAGEEIDFVDHIAAPFPVLVIAELLDIADADRATFRRWSDATIESPDHDGANVDDLLELFAFLAAHAEAHRAAPGDDAVSAIVTSEVVTADGDERLLTIDEAVTYLLALLVAGNETTRHLLSGSALALFEHPDQRAALAREPARLATAAEECLRWVTPIQTFGRTARCATSVGDVDIEEGDWVVLLYASANRDEDAFGASASQFDVTRPVDTAHLAFGFGEHLCLGASLARIEARVLLDVLLARDADYAIVGPPEWVTSTLVRGMHSLPAVLR